METNVNTEQHSPSNKNRKIKCLVWDLDNTLWNGTLLEDTEITLRPGVANIIKTLDERGVLQSIASRNDFDSAMANLTELGLDQYFLYPQINWNAKSRSIQVISEALNIGLDTIAFVDDQPFERDEVTAVFPQVICLDSSEIEYILESTMFNPRFITEDSSRRRLMYLADIEREKIESTYEGPTEDFLATLNMVFTIKYATESDLRRAEELTIRTNQLNTTGLTYSYAELNEIRQSPNHILLVSSLDDNYGTYGRIGLALIECTSTVWKIKLLLMSCRVMSRGVGTIMLNYIMRKAKAAKVRLIAGFRSNNRNRMMLVTYRFSGFKIKEQEDNYIELGHELIDIPKDPSYVKVFTPENY